MPEDSTSSFRERQLAKAAANRAQREAEAAGTYVAPKPAPREFFVDYQTGERVYKDEYDAWQATRKGPAGGSGGTYEHQKRMSEDPAYREMVQTRKEEYDKQGTFNQFTDKIGDLADFGVDAAVGVGRGAAILGSAYSANALAAGLQGIPMGAAAGTGVPASGAAAGFTDPSGVGIGGTIGAGSSAPMASNALASGAIATPVNMATMTGSTALPAGTAQVGVPGSVGGVSDMGASQFAGGAAGSAATGAAVSGAANGAIGAATNAGVNTLAGTTPSWLTPALLAGSSLASGYLANQASEDGIDEIRRQYDQNRSDQEPWRQAGLNALADYQTGINQPNNMYGEFQNNSMVPQYQNNAAPPPEYSPTEALAQYQNDPSLAPDYQATAGPAAYQNTAGAPPEYQDRSRFEFNMEEDPGYQFTRDQALQSTQRQQNAQGNALSGNVLTALQDRAGGVASQWSDQYRRSALGESQANYGRSMAEYGADTARNQDIYGRGVTDYGIDNARNQDIYGRNLQAYGIADKRNQDRYNRGVQDYGINSATNQAMYNRGTQDYGIQNARNQDIYGRGVQDYGLNLQGNQAQYGRDVGEYSMGVARNTDDYNRTQNTLNRQASLSGLGQTATAGLNNQGAQSAAQIAGLTYQGAEGVNNAMASGVNNYLSYQDQQANPGVPAWMRGRYGV